MKRRLTTFGAVLLLITVFFLAKAGVIAAWDNTKPIRVGIFPLGNFQNYDERGEPFGYNIDYLNRIAELRHWSYEYVSVENWVEGTTMLEQGEIDLLAPSQNIPEMSERFAFAAFPMGTEAAAVYVSDLRKDLVYQDFETMKTLRFGGAENSTFTKNFLRRAEEHGFTPDLTYYANTTELFDALDSGEVDAIVTNIMFVSEGIKIIDRFSPLPVYYISTKDNHELLEQLYDSMCAIELDDPAFATELMAEYFPYYGNTDFTYDELEYLKKLPEIKVGYRSGEFPLSYQDNNGEFRGITRDILDKVTEYSGLNFRYVPLPGEGADPEYLLENDIHVLCGVDSSLTADSLYNYIWLSKPYLNSEKVLISKNNQGLSQNEKLTMAVTAGSEIYLNIIKEMYPGFEMVTCNDIKTCFEMLNKGEVDLILQNRYAVEPFLAKPIYRDMKVLPIRSISDNLCIASLHLEGGNDLLDSEYFISIINKSIQHMSSGEINDIIVRHTTGRQYDYTLSDFLYQYSYLVITVAIFFIVLLAGLIKIQRMKQREHKILTEAYEQANRANTAKSNFLSNMSHEIRTPLNAIIGMAALAGNSDKNPQKTTKYLGKIVESSKLLMSIINDVLDMSAIERQKLQISNQSFDFKSLLTSISEMYYSQCRQKDITFEMKLNGLNREMLVGDSLRTNQILLNLLSNAFKFTEPGGQITVAVSETVDDKEKNKVYIRFVVEDTGCGMSADMMKRLFDPFEQENPDTALKHGGSGLGLAITKNLVSLMHGAISAVSEKGKGTAFTVDLPYETTDDVILANTDVLKKLKVLVVDDDSYMLEYMGAILGNMDVYFEAAPSGADALVMIERAYAEKKPYNVCFLDWRMPDMNGIQVARQLRENITSEVMTVIISAYDLSEVEEEAREAGVNHFITKPLFQSSIYNILTSVLGDSKRQDSGGQEFDFTGKCALLAEDFELNREVAVDLLALVNLDTECAENGREAVDMFLDSKPGTYDIILMDIQMPVMDGYEAIRTIRKSSHPQAAMIPIYALTANAFSEDVSKSISAGANGHIAKPIDSKALYKLLHKCLNSG